ncbi:MAG: baseplate J/gp47 family protein [Acidobacteria bacterium]|nr:baseplate J/gp47 family protein [Acidobacteriota bacterium]
MTTDCRNDCTEPLRFPRRPGQRFASASESCFCCEGGEHLSADNRAGLSHINYRIGTYASIREYLLHNLNKTASLQSWTHRSADDPGIALLEGAAILGDILTFYQELYANEAYLSTAVWRESIAELVRLVGYRLSPGIGGNATFAFEVKGTKAVTVPANFPVKAQLEAHAQPSEFETNAELVAYPWLSRFNLYRPFQPAQVTGATTEFCITSPNQFLSPVTLKKGDRLLLGDVETSAGGLPTKLAQAEIVLVDSVRNLHGMSLIKIKGALQRTNGSAQVAAFQLGRSFHHFGFNGPQTIVKTPNPPKSTATTTPGSGGKSTTTVTTELDQSNVSFYRSLTGTTNSTSSSSSSQYIYQGSPIAYYQYGYQGGIFGGIGYDWGKALQDFYDAVYGALKTVRTVSPSLGKQEFPLDAEVQDLPTGVPFIVQGTFSKAENTTSTSEFTLVRKISKVRSISATWGQLTAMTSLVTLDSALDTSVGDYGYADIRTISLHEVTSPALTLTAMPQETTAATGNVLAFYGTDAEVGTLAQRQLMLDYADAPAQVLTVTGVPTAATAAPLAQQLQLITLSQSVSYSSFPADATPVVTVYGNLAPATEGKTQPETVLGNGDTTQVFQTFKIPKTPLTYLISSANTPPETPELDVYVNGRLWQRVSTLFGRQGDEEIYIVREDSDGNSWVQFGDGKTGARLPTGIKNVSAIFRTGTGAFGNLQADAKVQAGARLTGLDKVQLPDLASGGAEPEAGDNARRAAPGKIQSLDRLVSLQDYEMEASAIPGVARASAAWQLADNLPAVVITVLMETGRALEIQAVQDTLSSFNRGRGPQRFPVIAAPGRRLYVSLNVQVAIDPTFRADILQPEIERVLGVTTGASAGLEDQTGLFSLRRRRFGQSEYATAVEGLIQQVTGVVWAKVTAFQKLSEADDPASINLAIFAQSFHDKVACDTEAQILSLYQPHLTLSFIVEAQSAEVS